MNSHKNAKTTPLSRAEIVRHVREEGQSPAKVAAAFGALRQSENYLRLQVPAERCNPAQFRVRRKRPVNRISGIAAAETAVYMPKALM